MNFLSQSVKYLHIYCVSQNIRYFHKILDISDIFYRKMLDIKIFCITICKYLPAESVEQNKQESKAETKQGVRHTQSEPVSSNNNPEHQA